MLRSLKVNEWNATCISNSFYENVLSSISNPETYKNRKVLDIEAAQGRELQFGDEEYEYDLISPPLFLDTASDAMGHYKDVSDIDKYGEAVIEVRTISNIGKPCLRKMRIAEEVQGSFLKDADHVEEQALALFDFLGNFKENIFGNLEQLREFLDMSIGKSKR